MNFLWRKHEIIQSRSKSFHALVHKESFIFEDEDEDEVEEEEEDEDEALGFRHKEIFKLFRLQLGDSVKCGCGRRMRTADGGWRTIIK